MHGEPMPSNKIMNGRFYIATGTALLGFSMAERSLEVNKESLKIAKENKGLSKQNKAKDTLLKNFKTA
jgi:hypothetical protein